MGSILMWILERGVTSSYLILVVLIVRLILKKASRKMICVLWLFVAVRLLLPFSLESSFSVIPNTSLEAGDAHITPSQVQIQEPAVIGSQNQSEFWNVSGTDTRVRNIDKVLWNRLGIVWLGGGLLLAGYGVLSYLKVRMALQTIVPLHVHGRKVYQNDGIDTPFILGLFHPIIYVPFHMKEEELTYIILHEEMHLRRKDNWTKIFGYLLLTIYWFHPLVWVSYLLFSRDIESACDESVIRSLSNAERAAYSNTLLLCAVRKSRLAAFPVAFGEIGVKKRIKNIMDYKRPPFWFTLLGLLVCVLIAVCFMTNQSSQHSKKGNVQKGESQNSGQVATMDGDKESITSSESVVEVVPAAYNRMDITGVSGPFLDYVDTEKIIFHGYFGLFVYSLKDEKLIREVDLASIGCQYTQGDNACQVMVSEDGGTVYLNIMSSKQMYVYNVAENTITIEEFQLEGISLYKGNSYVELNSFDGNIGELYYEDYNSNTLYFLFKEQTTRNLSNESPEDIKIVTSSDDFLEVGLPLFLTENIKWVQNPSYFILQDKIAEIQFYDGISDANAWIRCQIGEMSEFPFSYVVDEDQGEEWSERVDGHMIYITVSPIRTAKGEYGVLASWNYGDFQYRLIEIATDHELDLSVVAKMASTALSFSANKWNAK